ncbi:hypothetical protein HRG84_19245 [Flavisolibacter sp. BT320]|nr:hypothetical protein [Flavisolibacter longurius]
MSSVSNVNGSERAKIFETVFSAPGMKETCKIVLNPSRQTILLLGHLVEQGMQRREEANGDEILSFLPLETVGELRITVEEILERSGLTEFYYRLKDL